MNTSVFCSTSETRQFFVRLAADERAALLEYAERERRDPRDQAALIIRRYLKRARLIKSESRKRAEATTDELGQRT